VICANCKTENPNSNWYCLSCGQNLREQALAAGSRAEQAPAAVSVSGSASPGPAGKLFAGRYSELTRIGEGAMATVYRACDTILSQVVALKVLRPELSGNQDYIERFKREIALARTITHPNIYRIYDIGQDNETHFISMEYVDGEELKSFISRGALGYTEKLGLARQIASALEQAHGKGIIHRDLKPQNIMLEREGKRCVVMDFGIATGENSSALTVTGTFLGTPEYISPEQAQGLKLDQRTDIYSLGVIMYEMFTARLPFGPGKPVAVALSHVKETPVAPRKLDPEIPESLERVILKAMDKDPDRRYQDAAALIADLDRLLGTPAGERAVSPAPAAEVPAKPQNPYLSRKMIRDSRYFYGRKKESTTIFSRLGASRPQSVSIVGERRIGKSSLLHYISQAENRRAFLKNADRYTFISMDFQEKRGVPLKAFFSSLFEALEAETSSSLGQLPEPGYDGFKRICEELDRQDMRLILLFDEFESITKNKNFDPEFFSFLRSIANNYNVAYVTSSVKNLQELCYNREISDSPFFNIFSNLNLAAFTAEEARLFVSEPSRQAGHPLEEHFDTVVDLAGYFPFYMAIACSILFEFDFGRARPGKTVLENVEEQFLDEAGMHFQFILNNLTAEEKAVCLKLLTGDPLSGIERYVSRNLLKRGYLLEGPAEDDLRLFSRTFGNLLLEQSAKQNKS
jgi:serine/threonine protein kinase